ncbi:hypothetical protein M1N58_00150 [Dehalococcoidales bacterium]|nr:hypothetical protein [Dehalococcoidales bacterium]MCL0094300.1 hypothetical protein [Dehalococcoidales bacterium]
MTICIVALCDERQQALAVSDRMITASDVEFEQDASSKIEELTSNCVALTSGSALAHTELFDITLAELIGKPKPPIQEIVNVLKSKYADLRLKKAEEQFFKPLGITVSDFLKNQQSLHSTMVARLSRSLEEATYGGGGGLQVLLAGVDSAGAHVYYIADPGASECFDALGFCAIGSGRRHAESRLIAMGYVPSWPLKKVVYALYDAKKKAEIAPGVGARFTDIAVITKNQEIKHLGTGDLSELQQVYEVAVQGEHLRQASVIEQIDKLSILEEVK